MSIGPGEEGRGPGEPDSEQQDEDPGWYPHPPKEEGRRQRAGRGFQDGNDEKKPPHRRWK